MADERSKVLVNLLSRIFARQCVAPLSESGTPRASLLIASCISALYLGGPHPAKPRPGIALDPTRHSSQITPDI